MATLNHHVINAALCHVVDPYLNKDIVSLNAINNIVIKSGHIEIELLLGYPCDSQKPWFQQKVAEVLGQVPGVQSTTVDVRWSINSNKGSNNLPAVEGVKQIVAVASGKGGVGKSTTAVNLALALAAEGAAVGLLDADIYGPSLPQMLGVGDVRPELLNERQMLPVAAHGIVLNSIGLLVTEKTPMVWRGPMVSGALQQLLTQTCWPDLDYLIVDMPPGTGDIQLTLSQKVPVTGAVIVTTPQDIALLDAKKGIEMFRKVNVPILGVIENMAAHICSQCGHIEPVFGEGGGERITQDYQTRLLGSLPLDLSIRENTDKGRPPLVVNPESDISLVYREAAKALGAALWAEGQSHQAPQIIVSDD